jgi:signal transduction histidine kinase/ligand-binding sensor domain-containing protein/DNA-binding response OmpR family regulator
MDLNEYYYIMIIKVKCLMQNLKITSTISTLLLIVFLIGSVAAQELHFRQLSVDNGLSQNDVNSIVQDSFGFIWIGTFDGLNRFDGVRVESFHRESGNSESLPDNRISSLKEDDQKRLWVGTQAGDISYYSLLQEKFVRIPTPDGTGTVYDFLLTKDKKFYAATSNGILILNEDNDLTFEFIQSSKKIHFKSSAEDANGNKFFAGDTGVFLLDNGVLKKINDPTNATFTCIEVVNEKIILGSMTGLYQIVDLNQGGFLNHLEHIGKETILSLEVDNHGNLWVGTEISGLLQLDHSLKLINQFVSSQFDSRSLLSNIVLSLFFDRSNNLWVGNRQGLCFTSLDKAWFSSLKMYELNRPNIRNLYIEENDLFVGINNQGLFNFDLTTQKLEKLMPYDIKYVNQMAKIDDKLYVCSDQGLLLYDNDKRFQRVYLGGVIDGRRSQGIRSIERDEFGRIFLGTSNGIIFKDQNKYQLIWAEHPALQELEDYTVFRMHYDKKRKQLLVATISKGLIAINFDEKGDFLGLEDELLFDLNGAPISNTSIWTFHKDQNNSIWLGSDVGLFVRKSDSRTFEQIEIEGILDKKIMSIVEDYYGHLWLSNTHGLIQYKPESGKIMKYDYGDGLLSSSMTEASGKLGDLLFFGTTSGVNFINPQKLNTKLKKPEILLSNLKIHNELVTPGKELFGSVILNKNINSTEILELNHSQNNFSLEFAGTDYSSITKNRFRYRLENYDKKWINANENRLISYSNLDPGNYVLQIQAEDNEGNWAENSIYLPISIIPSPWKTPIAYLIYSLVLISIIIVFIYFYHSKQRLDHQIQLDQIKINQDKALREKQLRFFVDVAHEFKTPLSLILAPFNDLFKHDLNSDEKHVFLQIVSRNINRMNFLVNQLLDLGKITEGLNFIKVTKRDLRQTIREYLKSFEWQVNHENIDLRLNLDHCVGFFDQDVLEKGFYNILSNAFKYTPQGGTINISLKSKEVEGELIAIITVSDSGPGIPDEQKDRVFERFYHGKDRASSGIGLHLAQQLIQAHGGSIEVVDSKLGGAKFIVELPISKERYSNYQTDLTDETAEVYNDADTLFEEETAVNEETILIVEDDHDLRNYLKLSLQHDYRILESNNGEQGFEMAQSKLPDIIISDIMMPIMDGIEMCKLLKSNEGTSHIPILFLTAKTDVEMQKKGLDAGAWDYITKPFDSEVLHRKVENILVTRNRFKSYLLEHNLDFDIRTHYTSYDQRLLQNVNKVIEENLEDASFTVNDLANEVGLSRMHLHRKLKTLVGETGKEIIVRVKIKHAVSMFDQGCDRVQEVMNAIGMTNYGSFNNNFKKIMNITATEYLNNLKSKSKEIDH